MSKLREEYDEMVAQYGKGMANAGIAGAVVVMLLTFLVASGVVWLYLNLVGVHITYWASIGAFLTSSLLIAGVSHLASYANSRLNG